MKMQILVTVEFEQEALRRAYGPVLPPPTAQTVLDDLNRELRLWQASNPYALQDPEHLSVRLALADRLADRPEPARGVRVAVEKDLGRIADDLATLAQLCRAAS